ncbi:hypothetical protein D0T53_10005 [Dysgonomonas sp. 216]|uniref:ARPP-1 family domain-containing protein n=1 Tax=Dysgonomonas sp. 216 TaxID=2302934 RepID=UPI0013D0BBD9|nr:DUF6569 family protein [Dysgonomonas sp. 216]NDW19245.1 hypothetical protein [Dysgonomonas sp. 216]
MKRLFFIFIATIFIFANTHAQPKVVDKVYTHKNLSIFLLEGEDLINKSFMTLEEAMKQNKIALHETGNVNELSIDNKSDAYIFIMAGDIVKGGKQDRTIGEDVVLKPWAKKVPLKSFCVEQSRWRQRGAENVSQFSASTQVLSDKKIKIAARSSKNQSAVWKEVNEFQENASKNVNKNVKSSVSATSLQLTLEDKDLKALTIEYMNALKPALEGRKNITGIAFCINGKISTIEWFGNSALFDKLKIKLLESAANEAISNYDKNKLTSSDIETFIKKAIDENSNLSKSEIEAFIKNALKSSTITASDIASFIKKAKSKEFTSSGNKSDMIEKQYKTDNSIMFESFNAKISEQHPIHVSIYSTEGVAQEVTPIQINRSPYINRIR